MRHSQLQKWVQTISTSSIKSQQLHQAGAIEQVVCCGTELHWPVSHPSQKSHCSWFQGFQTARGNWSLQHGSPSVLSGRWSSPAETRMRTIRKQRTEEFTLHCFSSAKFTIVTNRSHQTLSFKFPVMQKANKAAQAEWRVKLQFS